MENESGSLPAVPLRCGSRRIQADMETMIGADCMAAPEDTRDPGYMATAENMEAAAGMGAVAGLSLIHI